MRHHTLVSPATLGDIEETESAEEVEFEPIEIPVPAEPVVVPESEPVPA